MIPAIDNDDVLQPALHEYVTVGVHPAKITGSQVCIAGPRHTPERAAPKGGHTSTEEKRQVEKWTKPCQLSIEPYKQRAFLQR